MLAQQSTIVTLIVVKLVVSQIFVIVCCNNVGTISWYAK